MMNIFRSSVGYCPKLKLYCYSAPPSVIVQHLKWYRNIVEPRLWPVGNITDLDY